MVPFKHLITLPLYVTTLLALPSNEHVKRKFDIDPVWRDQLIDDYRGVYWDTAIEECTEDQFRKIAEATRVAFQILAPMADDQKHYTKSAAFNRFFIRQGELPNKSWNNEFLLDRLGMVLSTFENLATFPTRGSPRKGADGQLTYPKTKQIKYKCNPHPSVPCGANTAAYTSNRQRDEDQMWTIVFCPKFFNDDAQKGVRYLNDIARDRSRVPADMKTPLLRSREHTLIHEFTHTGLISAEYDIQDIKEAIPNKWPSEVQVYGAEICHDFAWQFASDDRTDKSRQAVNPKVIYNADNYAWMLSNLFYSNRWGWSKDKGVGFPKSKHDELRREVADDLEEDPPLDGPQESDIAKQDDPSDFNGAEAEHPAPDDDSKIEAQKFCWWLGDPKLSDDAEYYCAYKGGDYYDWLTTLDQPFTSAGGCELSKECHVPTLNTKTIDPACVCKCDGNITPLSDPKCAGYEGEVPQQSTHGGS